MTYLDESSVISKRVTDCPRARRQDGYGSKIPCNTELQLADKRWRRVYVVCWSNSGSAYVIVGGKPHYITSTSDLLRS